MSGSSTRPIAAVIAAGAVAVAMVMGSPSATASTGAKARSFTCTGTLGRYDTKQTVTGTYKAGAPRNVTVLNWQDIVQVSKRKPKLDPTYDGGYWTQTYGLDQWNVGHTSDAAYHLMLPPPPIGSMFTALLKTDFLPNDGNWQNWMDRTS